MMVLYREAAKYPWLVKQGHAVVKLTNGQAKELVAKLTVSPLKGYKDTRTFECETCGALVRDTVQHEDFHDSNHRPDEP